MKEEEEENEGKGDAVGVTAAGKSTRGSTTYNHEAVVG